jgi:hypothetical protein
MRKFFKEIEQILSQKLGSPYLDVFGINIFLKWRNFAQSGHTAFIVTGRIWKKNRPRNFDF